MMLAKKAAIGLIAFLAILGVVITVPYSTHSSTSTITTPTVSSSSSVSTPNSFTTTTSSSSAFTMPLACHSVGGLPDPKCTPGATNPNVTQDNMKSTICVSGYTQTIRPPTSYTEPLKVKSVQQYGYNDTKLADYEEDHLIALELGGNPTDVRNLWAEPHYGTYTSFQKDGFENYLHAQICSGRMALAEAQQEIATNWVKYWIAAGEPKG